MASYLTIQPLEDGDSFPRLKGKTLSGRKVLFPKHVEGKISILIFYFYQEARPQVQKWCSKLMESYGKRKDVACYEVLMARDYARLYGFIFDHKLKRLIPRKRRDNVVTYYGKLEKYYYHFNVNSLTDCYLFMLDKAGKVRLSAEGPMTQHKRDQINAKIEELSAQDQLMPE